MELNVKHQAFADYYIELGNAEQAALKAGYSETYARGQSYKLLANVGIKSYIEKRMDEIKSERIADQQEILEFLTSVVRGEKSEEILRGVGKGAQTIDEMDVGASDRIKAAELLGKRYALWTDKAEVTQRIIEVNVGEYDDDN